VTEATAELDAAPPPQAPEAVASADAPAERALPEIEYAIGATRQAIFDHFLTLTAISQWPRSRRHSPIYCRARSRLAFDPISFVEDDEAGA
jgi:hypothetical protein